MERQAIIYEVFFPNTNNYYIGQTGQRLQDRICQHRHSHSKSKISKEFDSQGKNYTVKEICKCSINKANETEQKHIDDYKKRGLKLLNMLKATNWVCGLRQHRSPNWIPPKNTYNPPCSRCLSADKRLSELKAYFDSTTKSMISLVQGYQKDAAYYQKKYFELLREKQTIEIK